MTRRSLASLFGLSAVSAIRARSQSVAADAVTTFDADGTAHIKRAIPIPRTISPEAQVLMASGDRWVPPDGTKERDSLMDKMKALTQSMSKTRRSQG